MLNEHEIDVMCLQETELENNFNPMLLAINGYEFEYETNKVKSRTGMFIKNNLKYKRRTDLEGVDSNLIIIDILSKKEPLRLINIYRSFNPPNNVTVKDNFKYQLDLIKVAFNTETVFLGDFNLDYRRIKDDNFVHKNLFADFDEALLNLNVIQLIDFVTWSRIVGTVLKESILDHIYTQNPTSISNIYSIMPLFGDHRMIIFNVNEPRPKPEVQLRRDWRKYSKELLCDELK